MIIRQATPEDTEKVSELFKNNNYFEAEISDADLQALFHWQYETSPGHQRYQLVAHDGARILAHYAMIIVPFLEKGVEVLAGIGSNLIIDQAQRNGLLFLTLQKKFLNGYKEKDVRFTCV